MRQLYNPAMLEIGNRGEKEVAGLLKRQGWTILRRNQRTPMGEIDIIAREPNGALVFIEVKAALGAVLSIKPESHLDRGKLRRMKRAALFFSNSNPQLVNRKGWRIDAITIYLTRMEKDCVMHHYKNI